MNSKSFLQGYVQLLTEHFQENLESVVVFGSYARGEETENSDLDIYCFFKHIEPSVLEEVGLITRNYLEKHNKSINYPVCLTQEDYSKRGFDKTFGDPIKYFESKVLYGEFHIPKPSISEILGFCEMIFAEVIVNLRRHMMANTPSDHLVKGMLKFGSLKPLIVALRLERYLLTGNYPLTLEVLQNSLRDLPQYKAVDWLKNIEKFTELILKDKKSLLNELYEMTLDATNRLIHFKEANNY